MKSPCCGAEILIVHRQLTSKDGYEPAPTQEICYACRNIITASHIAPTKSKEGTKMDAATIALNGYDCFKSSLTRTDKKEEKNQSPPKVETGKSTRCAGDPGTCGK